MLEWSLTRCSSLAGPVPQYQWCFQQHKSCSSSWGTATAAPTEPGSHSGAVGCAVWPVLLRVRSCPAGGGPCLPQGDGPAAGTLCLMLDSTWGGAGEVLQRNMYWTLLLQNGHQCLNMVVSLYWMKKILAVAWLWEELAYVHYMGTFGDYRKEGKRYDLIFVIIS